MNERGSQVTVGRGRIRLRSSHRSARIMLHISHRRPPVGALRLSGRRDQEDAKPRPGKRKKKKWR